MNENIKKCIVCKREVSVNNGTTKFSKFPDQLIMQWNFVCNDCNKKNKKYFYIFIGLLAVCILVGIFMFI